MQMNPMATKTIKIVQIICMFKDKRANLSYLHITRASDWQSPAPTARLTTGAYRCHSLYRTLPTAKPLGLTGSRIHTALNIFLAMGLILPGNMLSSSMSEPPKRWYCLSFSRLFSHSTCHILHSDLVRYAVTSAQVLCQHTV